MECFVWHKMLIKAFLFVAANVVAVTNTVSYEPPVLVWPLAPSSPTTEIKLGVISENNGCSLASGPHTSGLDYPSLKFTGKIGSFVELDLQLTPWQTDFSFLVFISPENITRGVLLHYKQDQQAIQASNDFFGELIVSYNGDTLSGIGFDQAGQVVHSVNIPNPFAAQQTGQWYGVALSYDRHQKEMILSLNETSVSTSGSKKFGLGLPGKLRVGGAFDNAMTRFNGSMTCAQVKQDETRVHHFEIAMQECLTTKWPTVTASVAPTTCSRDKVSFYQVAKDKRPHPSVEAFYVATDVKSKLKCGDVCIKTERCVSFTFMTSLKECILYDDDQQTNVVSAVGTSYYVKKNVCC